MKGMFSVGWRNGSIWPCSNPKIGPRQRVFRQRETQRPSTFEASNGGGGGGLKSDVHRVYTGYTTI